MDEMSAYTYAQWLFANIKCQNSIANPLKMICRVLNEEKIRLNVKKLA